MTKIHINPPKVCDICKAPLTDTFYDFHMRLGPWANGCPECWERFRASAALGIGRGQRFDRQPGGEYLLTDGGQR